MHLTRRQDIRVGGLISGLVLAILGTTAEPATSVEVPQASPATSVSAPGPSAKEVSDSLKTAGSLVDTGATTSQTAEGFATSDAAVVIPLDAGGPVAIEGSDGSSVNIGLPGDGQIDAKQTADGILFQGAATDTTVIAKATHDGGSQLLVVLGSRESPTSFAFPVSGDAGSSLVQNDDGSVTLLGLVATPDGTVAQVVQGEFAPPWAIDAEGNSVQTSYEVRDMELVQRLHPDEHTVFPVTADPTFATGWTGFFVHWKKAEVKWMAGASLVTLGGIVGFLCGGPLCAGVVAGIWYGLNSVSNATVEYLYDRGYRYTSRLTPFIASNWEKR